MVHSWLSRFYGDERGDVDKCNEAGEKIRIICEVGSLKLVCGTHISHDANHALSKVCDVFEVLFVPCMWKRTHTSRRAYTPFYSKSEQVDTMRFANYIELAFININININIYHWHWLAMLLLSVSADSSDKLWVWVFAITILTSREIRWAIDIDGVYHIQAPLNINVSDTYWYWLSHAYWISSLEGVNDSRIIFFIKKLYVQMQRRFVTTVSLSTNDIESKNT